MSVAEHFEISRCPTKTEGSCSGSLRGNADEADRLDNEEADRALAHWRVFALGPGQKELGWESRLMVRVLVIGDARTFR